MERPQVENSNKKPVRDDGKGMKGRRISNQASGDEGHRDVAQQGNLEGSVFNPKGFPEGLQTRSGDINQPNQEDTDQRPGTQKQSAQAPQGQAGKQSSKYQ